MNWYERCLTEMDTIADTFGDLGAALDRHAETLRHLQNEIADSPDQGAFRAWLVGQQQRLAELQSLIDDQAHDLLLRVADRVIRIKHWEDGEFV